MVKTSLDLAPYARVTRARPQNRRSRRAALLIGTGLFLHAAPTWGACTTTSPGTVTCSAGEYPNGINFASFSSLEIILQPGVVTRRSSSADILASVRIIGPVNTSLNAFTAPADVFGGGFALHVFAIQSLFVEVDDLSGTGKRAGGILATGSKSAIVVADTVITDGLEAPGVQLYEGDNTIFFPNLPPPPPPPPGFPSTGAFLRVNSVTTQGDESTGVLVTSNSSGQVRVEVGSVITKGLASPGLIANTTSASPGQVFVDSGTVSTKGDQSGAIVTSADLITVKSGSIVTQGANSAGITATGRNIAITSGSISTSGTTSPAIFAVSNPGPVNTGGTGAIEITGDGTIVTTGASSPGISAESVGPVTVSANNISSTGANSDAIAVKGSTSTVTIRGVVQSSQGFAIRGEGGLRQGSGPGGPVTATILSGGTLRGRVSLTGGADRINNSGTFDAIGTSFFGAGADRFENNAGGTVQSANGAAVFAGLETFNNRGTIDMRDGAAGDSLSLGSYDGAGAALLGLDVDFAAGTADRLVAGAATGATLIELHGVGGGFTSGILIVDAGAGTSPTAFALAPGTSNAYLRRDLRFDSASNDFFLTQGPGAAVFETARFGAIATSLWYESGDAVAAQLDTQRDGSRGRGVALWLQGWTGERERSGTQTLAGAGTFDVSFEQEFQGLQGGLDFQSGSAVFGITGGAGRSDAAFLSGNPVDMKVKNVGLYAQVRAGPLFFNALAKRDWAELEIAPGAGLGAEFDADLFGVQLNTGLRLKLGAVFAEPSVGLSWVQADLDSFDSGPATIDPGDVDSLRARAGLRVGAKLPLGGGALHPFAAVNVYEELGGDNETDFTLGETLRLLDEPAGTRSQGAAGVSFASGGFEAFVRGEMDFSGDADAKAVRAGARLRF